jgi:hypothetical protein
MAAPLGFKDFTTGEVLTAADVDGYLMQGIWVFANATARDAAVTSPQEGNFAFTKDNNSLWYYDGAAWVASGATGDIEGVTAGVGISGGGTSGTVTITNSMATAIDAKGDLVAGTGADTFSKLTVGANDTVLTADSTTATGLKWAAAAGGGANWTLLNSGGTALTGADTITVSSISGANKIMVRVTNASAASSNSMTIRFNANSSSIYSRFGGGMTADTNYSSNVFFNNGNTGTSFPFGTMANSGNAFISGGVLLDGCNSSGVKPVTILQGANFADGSGQQHNYYHGIFDSSATISSVSIISSGGNFDAGTIYVYTSA